LKELQANHLASFGSAENRKKSHQKISTALSDAASVLRRSNKTNIPKPEIQDAENDTTIPRTALTTPSPVARRDFLAKKAHLLGSRGSAYAFSPYNQHTSKHMFSPDANTVPRAHSAIKAEPDVVKNNPAPFKAKVANIAPTPLTNPAISSIQQKQGHVQESKKQAEEDEAKRRAVTMAVAKKYTWETKLKQEAPKPNKTASRAMSFRSAKLRHNTRSIAKLVDMISPKASQDSTLEPPLDLEASTEPKMPKTQVPSFEKNTLETLGKDMMTALGKLQLESSSNDTHAVIPLPFTMSPRSPTPVKSTRERRSMKDRKSSCRILNTPSAPVVTNLPRSSLNHLIAPKQWDYNQVCSFLKKKNCIDEDHVVPERIDGRVLMRMNTIQIKITFFDGKRDADERAVKLFRCLRAETGRVSEIELKRRVSAPSI
jgi:hypothetical protein